MTGLLLRALLTAVVFTPAYAEDADESAIDVTSRYACVRGG
jgi:hypothetical protein